MLAGVRLCVRQIDAAADRLFFDGPNREVRRQESPLDIGVVGEPGRKAEQLLIDVEVNGRLVVRRWHEDTLVGRDPGAHHGWSVEVSEEDQDIVLMLITIDVLEQWWTPWTLLLEPLDFVFARVRIVEYPFRVAIEGVDIARMGIGEASDRDPAHPIRSFGILVFPGDVVLSTRRQHLDVMLGRHAFGNEPAVIFGSTEDLRAVTLDDKRNLQ